MRCFDILSSVSVKPTLELVSPMLFLQMISIKDIVIVL